MRSCVRSVFFFVPKKARTDVGTNAQCRLSCSTQDKILLASVHALKSMEPVRPQ
jgi:hypothetical protein